MREEFNQPTELHMVKEFRSEGTDGEFHTPSAEYHVVQEEQTTPSPGAVKPSKSSFTGRMWNLLYAVSATVVVTASAQAIDSDFVVFADPFAVAQESTAENGPASGEDDSHLSTTQENPDSNPVSTVTPASEEAESTGTVEHNDASETPQSSAKWTDCPDCEGGVILCPACNGDWEYGAEEVADIDCENCENGIVKRQETIYIYNGTPCKVCNDVGTFVNVNGETEECGECRAYASRHQVGEKQVFEYYNHLYREYAFDTAYEYVDEDCPECAGRGTIAKIQQVPCKDCSEGYVECPVCEGAGGWYE